MTVSQPAGHGMQSRADRTLLVYESATTRVHRMLKADRSPGVIHKEPLGANAVQRLQHERNILALLKGVQGISQPVADPDSPGLLTLQDAGNPLEQAGRGVPAALPALLAFSRQVAQVLAAVHQAGVIHGDINPRNILFSGPQGTATLVDFDLGSSAAVARPRLLGTGRMAGTVAYMSPEQTGRTGRAVDQRSDLYSLGVTLYELATGRLPFDSRDLLALVHGHLAQVPQAPATLNPDLPRQLSDIIMCLLEKEPRSRYQSAQGLGQDLARLADRAGNDSQPFALRQHDFGARLVPPSRLIGRRSEIAFLGDLLDTSIKGAGSCALVMGPAGIGKTALVNEFRPLVAARSGWFVTSAFHQYQKGAPADALRTLGRLLLAEPEDQLSPLRERILRASGANIGVGPMQLPEFVLLLGEHPPVEIGDPREAETRIVQATLDLLGSVASAERPLVVVLDNLQWGSSIALRCFDTLATRPPIPGLLVVATCHGDGADANANANANANASVSIDTLIPLWEQMKLAPARIRLSGLLLEPVAELVAEMLRLPLEQSLPLANALNPCTAGNPRDTVELLNAVRQEGLLKPCDGGWDWDGAAIRDYVGECSVSDLLTRRIASLPAQTRTQLEIHACLGAWVGVGMLEAASGMDAQTLQHWLRPALENRLVLLDVSHSSPLRFQHPRIQQAFLEGIEPARRAELHLLLARRLLRHPEFHGQAAEQFLPAVAGLTHDDERFRVADLFRHSAARVGALDFGLAERFLHAATLLLQAAGSQDAELLDDIEIEHHRVLYGLGRLAEGDAVFTAIAARRPDPMALAAPAAVQMYSLVARRRYQEAVDMGLGLLGEFGLVKPDNVPDDLRAGFQRLIAWRNADDKQSDFVRPIASDPRILTMATLVSRTAVAAYFCDQPVSAWLMLESLRMWTEHGPCAQLIHGVGAASVMLVGRPQDYQGAYECARHVVAVGEARGFEPATATARFSFLLAAAHWVDPLESVVEVSRRARVGLLQGGDLTLASYTYLVSDLLFDCMPTLEPAVAEALEGQDFAERIGNADYIRRCLPRRQLIRSLRGETTEPGGFSDADFDDSAYVATLAGADATSAIYHATRTIAAAIFGDTAGLARHAAPAMQLLWHTPGYYITAICKVLAAVSFAEQARSLPPADRTALLDEMDTKCLRWLELRAAAAPANFLHLLRWVEAERAWAAGTLWEAGAAFDAAVEEAALHQRPWHRAIIRERAGLFHLSHGLETTGRALLATARAGYEAWGAFAKVQAMERTHPYLRVRAQLSVQASQPDAPEALISTEAIDLMGVVRASQSLSSETSLEQLRLRVTELLGTMTGATKVLLALWNQDAGQWMLPDPATASAGRPESLTVDEGGRRGMLPLSAFRYVERTLQPLLVKDATRDDRFAGDAYFEPLERCSLLVIPILGKGVPRAILLLENGLSAGAFSADRLDAVTLIAGQLAVSLENAQLYAELELRVLQRTQELRATQEQLIGTARRAGRAEIASNVLHNVGNILNSVNTSASLIRSRMRASRVQGLGRAVEMLDAHASDLGHFLTVDEKGRLLPRYLGKLAQGLIAEQQEVLRELEHLSESVEFIKNVVATQQSHAGGTVITEPLRMAVLVDEALRINATLLKSVGVVVRTEFADVPPVELDKTRVMQVLVNLITNAAQAMETVTGRERLLTLRVEGDAATLRVCVSDQGVGITVENLTRIFSHGFTTRATGHGFGLHSCALAALQMGGKLWARSDGPGQGASFTLQLPIEQKAGWQQHEAAPIPSVST